MQITVVRIFAGFLALASFFAAAASPSHAQFAPPANNRIFGIDLSPDGSAYAILKQYGDQRVAAIYDVDNSNTQPVTVGLGDIETGSFAWGGENHVLLQVYGEQGGIDTTEGLKTLKVSRWLSISKDTGKAVTLFGRNELGDDYFYITTSAGTLLSTLPNQANRALFARHTLKRQTASATRLREGDDTFVLSLLSANLENARARRSEQGNERTIDWVVNENGDAIARIDASASDRQIAVFTRRPGNSSFNLVKEIDYDDGAIERVNFYGAAENDGAIQALVTDKAGGQKLVEFDMNTGAFGNVMVEPVSGRMGAVEFDYRRGKITAVYTNGGEQRVYHLSETDRIHQERLEKALQGAAIAIISKSVNGERMIMKALYANRRTEYYFYDKPRKRLELIAQE